MLPAALLPGRRPFLPRISEGRAFDRRGHARTVLSQLRQGKESPVLHDQEVSAAEMLRVIGPLPGSRYKPYREKGHPKRKGYHEPIFVIELQEGECYF